MLSVKESADMLGVTPARVRALIAQKALSAQKVGRSWVIKEEDILDRLSRHPKAGRPVRTTIAASGVLSSSVECNEALHDAYVACRDAFRFRPTFEQLQQASDSEEAAFYVAVADFFLQQRQRNLVAQGAY